MGLSRVRDVRVMAGRFRGVRATNDLDSVIHSSYVQSSGLLLWPTSLLEEMRERRHPYRAVAVKAR